MRHLPLLMLPLVLLAACAAQPPATWPSAAGPNGDWRLQTPTPPPEQFSVAAGERILWNTLLPEGGQSGIAVWGDRLFLSILKPIDAVKSRDELMVSDIVALCVDANSGRIVWSRPMAGSVKSEAMSGFSDSSTPTPVTDGKRVVFTNASGRVACFDFDGKVQWEHVFRPVETLGKTHFPFNKQVEPMLADGLFIHMEPDWAGSHGPVGWNRLAAYDLDTGRRRWMSQDALTHYNCPQLARQADGKWAVLIGRGGHHGVPENPMGYSLINLADGKRLWSYAAKEGSALYNACSDGREAVWMSETGDAVQLLDAKTGLPTCRWSLTERVEWHAFEKLNLATGPKLKVFPAWYSNILVDRQLFFLCFKSGRFRQNIGPAYCAARLNLDSGRIEYLELPTDLQRTAAGQEAVWRTEVGSDTRNLRGLDVARDARSKRDGWHWNFNANAVAVNHRIYYTLMNGRCYCLATDTPDFDACALRSVSDLGPAGGTWSLTTPTPANGRLYLRSLRELICVGQAGD